MKEKYIYGFIGGGLFVMVILFLMQNLSPNISHLITERTYIGLGMVGAMFGTLFIKSIEEEKFAVNTERVKK